MSPIITTSKTGAVPQPGLGKAHAPPPARDLPLRRLALWMALAKATPATADHYEAQALLGMPPEP